MESGYPSARMGFCTKGISMQPLFFARRSVALGIAIILVVVSVGSMFVWRAAIGRQAAAGGSSGPASNGAAEGMTDPARVHEQWVVALRDGDRPQALRLYAPGDLHDAAVDSQLQRMDSKLHSPSSTLGQLVQVTPEAPKVDGARARGTSRWVFASGATLCFETRLNRDEDGAWFVTDYGTISCS
jgi:hypothetical protein